MISTIKRARVWRQAAAAAFAAIAILVLRPVCEAAEPLPAADSGFSQVDTAHGHDHPESDSCCASMSDASIMPAAVAVAGLAELSFVAPALTAATQHPAPEVWRAAPDPAAPPRSLSYHARSARLLL